MQRPLSRVQRKAGNRIRFGIRGALAFVAALAWLGLAAARGATFTATLDRDTITLGQSATLSLAFTDGTPQNVPAPPDIPNLQVSYIGPSSLVNFFNGQVTSSVTHNFKVTPQQPGDYTIPALSADVAGQKLSTQPLTLKVLKPGTPPPAAAGSGTQAGFLKLVLPKKEVYVGETFTAQVQCYVLSRLVGSSQLQPVPIPAEGLTVGKLAEAEGQRQRVQVGNAVYNVIVANVALKAVKTGQLTLGPVTFNLLVNQRDPFDPFSFFGRAEARQFPLVSETATVESLPLARDNVPPDFTGAVGNFNLAMTAGPTNVTVGDPITVRFLISGRGSLDSLSLPDLPAWHDFKLYPPSVKVETTDPLGLQGTKTFEQLVVPEKPEIKELPPVSLSFFDPDQKRYRTLTQAAVPLVVQAAPSTPAPTMAAANRNTRDSPPPALDLVPIKQRLGAVAQIGPPLVQQRWFVAVQGIPVAAWVSALLWRRRADKLANNPRLRRRRQVAQLTRVGLGQLRELAAENNSEEFFATLFRLLQEQLGERLDMPASAITEAVIEEGLRPRGVPETTLAPLHELFQICNLVRYAPIKTSHELAAVIQKFEAVSGELQELNL